MTDLDQILPFWQELRDGGQEYVLATIIEVEGSGYRKPGARMLIAKDGRRTGTVSGGCLEAEVARKAFWHTESGPVIRRYSTKPEDGDVPYGMGCGGVVHVLLERTSTAAAVMQRVAGKFAERRPMAIATVLSGPRIGQRAYWTEDSGEAGVTGLDADALSELAHHGSAERRSSCTEALLDEGEVSQVFVEWLPARPGLFVFGAGDDAMPLVRLGRQMGWYVTLLDGRAHLATRSRFPEAHEIRVLPPGTIAELPVNTGDAAALLTHSLEQDTRALEILLEKDLAYIGVLGPRRRTEQMVAEIAAARFGETSAAAQAEAWMRQLHAPMGLDLGGNTPAAIALAAAAEIQQSFHHGSGLPLRVRRADEAACRVVEMPA